MTNQRNGALTAVNDKWSAVVNCDKRFDGLFFYGVRSTGIFCRPSCTSKTPRRENVRFFHNVAEAVRSGFRPCKKCRPDLTGYDPGRELVEQAKERYARSIDLPESSALPAISSNHLARLFKKYEGCTPGRYLAGLRIEKAKKMLAETNMSILDIALLCGFDSLSNFYRRFREYADSTPAQFRNG